jgi:cytochrome c-type biogenesis protein CcmE
MRRDRRFLAGLAGVALMVTYLIWTGISDTMMYYLTPSELVERARANPALHEQGVKVSGNVVPGSHRQETGELLNTFVVTDPDHPDVRLTVLFPRPLPDTFTDEAEVVMEGRYRPDGTFEATEVLTKCGSRYEAIPEESDYYPVEATPAPDEPTAPYGTGQGGGSG